MRNVHVDLINDQKVEEDHFLSLHFLKNCLDQRLKQFYRFFLILTYF